MPTISVVIPVYNGAKTIRETIASVLAQSFEDLEVLVINDGSTDETGEIVQRIADPRLKLLNYPNAGLAASRNRGIHRAKGEYISFIDADDLWTPDKLAAQYQALQEHPQAQVAYSWTDWIDEHSRVIAPGSTIDRSGNVYPYMLLCNILASGSNPLISRQALAEVGDFDESLRAAEDWDLWIRLAARYEFIAVPQPQIQYRRLSYSMSGNLARQERETLKVIRKAFEAAPPQWQFLRRPSLANVYRYLAYKCIEGKSPPLRALKGMELWLKMGFYDPAMLRYRVTWKVLLLMLLAIVPGGTKLRHPRLTRVRHFLAHTRVEP